MTRLLNKLIRITTYFVVALIIINSMALEFAESFNNPDTHHLKITGYKRNTEEIINNPSSENITNPAQVDIQNSNILNNEFNGLTLESNINNNTNLLFENLKYDNNFKSKYKSHFLTNAELNELKEKVGIWNSKTNYNVVINGYGTGLAPPDEEEWNAMIGNVEVVESVYTLDLPTGIDHSRSKYFPAVGNQGIQGSCTSWMVTYYTLGYYQANETGWTQASTGNTKQLLSPAWTYNKINKGSDSGSNFYRNYKVLETIGTCTMAAMPYDDKDYISWGTEQAWREAPLYRVNSYMQTSPKNIDVIRSWVCDGRICTISIDGHEYGGLGIGDNIISSIEYNSTSHNHANAVVGYDDLKIVDGEIGAFKIVNSWGDTWGVTKGGRNNSGGWDGYGYYWMTYKAFAKLVRPVYTLYDKLSYEPKLLATWNFSGNCSRDSKISIKVGNTITPLVKREPYQTASVLNYPEFMCLDITEFCNYLGSEIFYLDISDGVNKTNITSFKIELYNDGYSTDHSNNPLISRESADVPKQTPTAVSNILSGIQVRITSPKHNQYCKGTIQCTGSTEQLVSETVLFEDFELNFQKKWSLGDSKADSGLDYWGNSTTRSNSGFKSAWCAGTQIPVFQDNFDKIGQFSYRWALVSENISSTNPWNITNLDYSFVYGGDDYGAICNSSIFQNISEMMYTKTPINVSGYDHLILEFFLDFRKLGNDDYAQVLYTNQSPPSNFTVLHTWNKNIFGKQRLDLSSIAGDKNVTIAFRYHGEFGNYMFIDDFRVITNKTSNTYDNNMSSYLIHNINLTKFDTINLSYDYWLDSEPGIDFLYVQFQANNTWHIIANHTGSSYGWISNIIEIPSNATNIGFKFYSDSENSNYEGAYVDNIKITGNINLDSVSFRLDNGVWSNLQGLKTWSRSINTQNYPEGVHEVTVRATFGLLQTYDFISIIMDNSPPKPFIPQAEPPGWTANPQPTILFEAMDAISYIDYYKLKIDDGSFTTQTSPYILPPQSEGLHTVTVRAFDILGHYRDGVVDIFIDTSKPLEFIPSATPSGWTNNRQPVISFEATDWVSGIEYYQLNIDDGNFTNQSSPYTVPVMSDGIHQLKVRAYDKANNFIEGNVDVFIDTKPPKYFQPTATPGNWTNIDTPTISFSTMDDLSGINNYEIKVDHGKFSNQKSPYKLPKLIDGIHNITVRAYDFAGNFIYTYVDVYIDTTPPNTFKPSVKSNEWTNEPPTILFETSDITSGLAYYEIKIDTEDYQIQISPYVLPKLSDGTHEITIRAFDNAGNRQQSGCTVYIDTQAPELVINEPVENDWLKDSKVTISWNCSDELSGVTYCKIKIDDRPEFIKHLENDEGYSHTIFDLENGEHILNLTIFDQANNFRSTEISFYIDDLEPYLTIIEPKDSSYFNVQSVEIRWDGYDFDSQISYYETWLNEDEPINMDTQTIIIFNNLAEGKYSVHVRAWDHAGNMFEESLVFYIDLSQPLISIIKPEDQARISTVDIICTWMGSDLISGIHHYEIRLDDEPFKNVGKISSYTYLQMSKDKHTIIVRAVDRAGNYCDAQVNFQIGDEEKEGSKNGYTSLIVLVSIIVIIFLIVLLLFFKKQKKQKDKKTINHLSLPSPSTEQIKMIKPQELPTQEPDHQNQITQK